MKNASATLALALIALAGCSKAPTAASSPNAKVPFVADASVGSVLGQPITNSDLAIQLQNKPSARVVLEGREVELPIADTLEYQALEDIIRQRLTLDLAKEQGVLPTDADVDAAYKLRSEADPEYLKQMAAKGISVDRIKTSLKLNLALENLFSKGVTVTEKDVDEYIASPSVQLQWIIAPDDKTKQSADAALKSGKAFDAVAMQFSKDPNVQQTRGDFPVRNQGDLPPAVKDKVVALQVGGITDWIKFPAGFAKFKLIDRKPAPKMDLNPAQKELLRRQIAVDRGRLQQNVAKQLVDKMKSAKVQISDPALKAMWDRTMSAMAQPAPQSR